MMKKFTVCFGLASFMISYGGEKKVSLFTGIDIGRVEKGYDQPNKTNASGIPMNRTYVDVGFTEKLDEQYFISVGVGGIFWQGYEQGGGGPDGKVIKFGPGISNAYMKYAPSQEWAFTFGYFPYKYNNAAKNLGEYLFRTEAYPTIIYTGGWSWLNDAKYSAVGGMVTWDIGEGKFKQDLGLFGEYFNAPIYDITPAYIATWKPMAGITLGGAGSLHRFITPTPNTKKELTRDYRYYENFYLPAIVADTAQGIKGRAEGYYTKLEDDLLAEPDFDASLALPNNAGQTPKTTHFDLSAIKLMAYFELDFNNLFGLEKESMGEFNLYGEVAQLGLNNYPLFYTDMAQRRPVMVGFSVPTFGLLNSISLEVEYLKNPNVESIRSTYDKLDLPPDEDFRYQIIDKDDMKWSLHASKNFNQFLSLYVQFANDHLRLKNPFAQPNYIPLTNEPSHWYWLTRIQWAI